jgi:hypothetical protein
VGIEFTNLFPFQSPRKFTQKWDFWFKDKHHLATLPENFRHYFVLRGGKRRSKMVKQKQKQKRKQKRNLFLLKTNLPNASEIEGKPNKCSDVFIFPPRRR